MWYPSNRSVKEGTILRFDIQQGRKGVTSVQYLVNVYASDPRCGSEESVFTTTISYVCLDDDGKKKAI
ncbi:MAG: hypothetical protein ABW092_01030 [Candidatus Thiodiazotropha sp.]